MKKGGAGWRRLGNVKLATVALPSGAAMQKKLYSRIYVSIARVSLRTGRALDAASSGTWESPRGALKPPHLPRMADKEIASLDLTISEVE